MSDPEIARRCTACGISVRQRAAFCPQCGNPISQVDTAPTEALIAPPPQPQIAKEPERVRGRVDKFRKVSSIMIDQAAYDPSLRFLLVAAGLFLLFLVLLILSKVIGYWNTRRPRSFKPSR